MSSSWAWFRQSGARIVMTTASTSQAAQTRRGYFVVNRPRRRNMTLLPRCAMYDSRAHLVPRVFPGNGLFLEAPASSYRNEAGASKAVRSQGGPWERGGFLAARARRSTSPKLARGAVFFFVAVELVVKRLQADPEFVRGARLVPCVF